MVGDFLIAPKHCRLTNAFLFSFSLNLNTRYDLKDFYLLDSNQVLKVKFHWPFILKAEGKFSFFTKRKNLYQFSKVLKLRKFSWAGDSPNNFLVSYHYSISQELFLLVVEDRFTEIKNLFKGPLFFFGGHDDIDDVNRYLHRLWMGFNETNRATLSLPLKKDLFDLEVNESAFESYLFEKNEEDGRAAASSNFQREYAINYLQKDFQTHGSEDEFYKETKADLTFGLIFFKKVK